MSRIGKIPVQIPKEVKVSLEAPIIRFEGAKGKLSWTIPPDIKIDQKENQLIVNRLSETKQCRSSHGTVRSHIVNSVSGVTKGHRKELELQGLGFRAQLQGTKIVMNLGLSHLVEFDVPQDIKIQVPSQTSIIIEGADKCRVGEIAAQIFRLKPVEPYKGKGFRFSGQHVRRKQGKSVTKK